MQDINNASKHKLFYLNGPGGCGKTYLYNVLIQYVESKGQSVITSASSGIASLLIKNGMTVHSCFGIPVPTLDNTVYHELKWTLLKEIGYAMRISLSLMK